MPFFFILPVWVLSIVVSVPMLLSGRFRIVGAYISLTSTGGLAGSFLVSTAALMLGGKMLGGTAVAWITPLLYVLGICVGGMGGITIGALIARKLTKQSSVLS
jgi:hypothetical protein